MTDPTEPSGWALAAQALATVVISAGAWYAGRHKGAVERSEMSLATQANGAVERALLRLDGEIKDLKDEIDEMRLRERRLRRYINTLIAKMREGGITPPEYFDTEENKPE